MLPNPEPLSRQTTPSATTGNNAAAPVPTATTPLAANDNNNRSRLGTALIVFLALVHMFFASQFQEVLQTSLVLGLELVGTCVLLLALIAQCVNLIASFVSTMRVIRLASYNRICSALASLRVLGAVIPSESTRKLVIDCGVEQTLTVLWVRIVYGIDALLWTALFPKTLLYFFLLRLLSRRVNMLLQKSIQRLRGNHSSNGTSSGVAADAETSESKSAVSLSTFLPMAISLVLIGLHVVLLQGISARVPRVATGRGLRQSVFLLIMQHNLSEVLHTLVFLTQHFFLGYAYLTSGSSALSDAAVSFEEEEGNDDAFWSQGVEFFVAAMAMKAGFTCRQLASVSNMPRRWRIVINLATVRLFLRLSSLASSVWDYIWLRIRVNGALQRMTPERLTSARTSGDVCCVCLCAHDDQSRVLRCGHALHRRCVLQILHNAVHPASQGVIRSRLEQLEQRRCPLCRVMIFEDEIKKLEKLQERQQQRGHSLQQERRPAHGERTPEPQPTSGVNLLQPVVPPTLASHGRRNTVPITNVDHGIWPTSTVDTASASRRNRLTNESLPEFLRRRARVIQIPIRLSNDSNPVQQQQQQQRSGSSSLSTHTISPTPAQPLSTTAAEVFGGPSTDPSYGAPPASGGQLTSTANSSVDFELLTMLLSALDDDSEEAHVGGTVATLTAEGSPAGAGMSVGLSATAAESKSPRKRKRLHLVLNPDNRVHAMETILNAISKMDEADSSDAASSPVPVNEDRANQSKKKRKRVVQIDVVTDFESGGEGEEERVCESARVAVSPGRRLIPLSDSNVQEDLQAIRSHSQQQGLK